MGTLNLLTLEGVDVITTGPEVTGDFGDTVRPLVCRVQGAQPTRQFIIWQKQFDNGEWAVTPGSNPTASQALLIRFLSQ